MTNHVVVVEDDPWQADQYTRLLERQAFSVSTASNAVTAIDMIDEKKPDVILLDLLLGGTTAMTLLNELQSHHDLAMTPIILITANAEQVPEDTMKPYGVVEILDKLSMHPNDVVKAVKRVMK